MTTTTLAYLANSGALGPALAPSPMAGAILTGVLSSGGGLLAGVTIGAVGELLAQQIERPTNEGKEPHWGYKVLAGMTRVGMTLSGAGLTTTALLGVLGISAAATVCVASMGVGIAVVGVLGISYSLYRYYKKKQGETIQGLGEFLISGDFKMEEWKQNVVQVAKKTHCEPDEVFTNVMGWILKSLDLSRDKKKEFLSQLVDLSSETYPVPDSSSTCIIL